MSIHTKLFQDFLEFDILQLSYLMLMKNLNL